MGELKSEGRFRPTKAWRHKGCGGRLERNTTPDGYTFLCQKCGELTTMKMGDVEQFELEE